MSGNQLHGRTPGMRFVERLAKVRGIEWGVNAIGQIHGVERSGRPTYSRQTFDPITAVVWEVAEEWWPSEKAVQAAMEKLGLREHEAVCILLASDFPEPPPQLDDRESAYFKELRQALEEATINQQREDHPPRGLWNWIRDEWPKVDPDWSPWPEDLPTINHSFDAEDVCTGCGMDRRMAIRLRIRCYPGPDQGDQINARALLARSGKPHEFDARDICERCGTSREGVGWRVYCR